MANETVRVEPGTGSDAVVLAFGEALTVWCVGEGKAALAEALARGKRIEVDLGGTSELDLTALQLLCAAHRSAVAEDKTLTVRGADPAVGRLAEAAGFARHKGCAGGCLWVTGGEP